MSTAVHFVCRSLCVLTIGISNLVNNEATFNSLRPTMERINELMLVVLIVLVVVVPSGLLMFRRPPIRNGSKIVSTEAANIDAA